VTSNPSAWTPLTPEHVQLLHLDFAARMVDQLVPYTEDPNYPAIVQNACLESFFVNVRLLAEFLQGKGRERSDFWATALLSSWTPEDGQLDERLDQWWDLASKHVIHFGMPRLAHHEEDALNVTLDLLKSMRDDVLTVYRRFRSEYRISLPLAHPDKRLGLPPSSDSAI
jgi:hypothetical protein